MRYYYWDCEECKQISQKNWVKRMPAEAAGLVHIGMYHPDDYLKLKNFRGYVKIRTTKFRAFMNRKYK